jgi:drug/metabolite transporter (DMT)-like permease
MAFISVIFALAAAIGWGITDYIAALTSVKIGHFRTAYFSQMIGTVLIFLVSLGSLGLIIQFPLATYITIGLGLLNLVAVLSSYKSFETGKLSIVSPLQSSFPALSTVLAIIFLGELVSTLRALGIVITLGGIVVVTMRNTTTKEIAISTNSNRSDSKLGKGIGFAVIAFLAYGLLYFALKIVVVDLGPLIPVLIQRLAVVFSLSFILPILKPAAANKNVVRTRNVFILLLIIGCLDVLAGLAYNYGILGGQVSVVSTISGLYSVVTVVLAMAFLKDRLSLRQSAGVVAILIGVGLLGFTG